MFDILRNLFPKNKTRKLEASKPNGKFSFFDGYVDVENKNDYLDIKISDMGMDKLYKCIKSNDPIKILRNLSKKEDLDIIPEERYDNPVCSAYKEGAYRVLVDTCIIRYKQLYLEERKH